MALVRLTIDGFGQLELNNAAFRRDGRVEAQCALSEDFSEAIPAENGMLLAVDNIAREVRFAEAAEKMPIALHYSAEHMYDERKQGLKHFSLVPGTVLPRMGYLSVGDKFTTNTVCYDNTEFNAENLFIEALGAINTTKLYGTSCENGTIKVTKTEPTQGIKLLVIKKTTMPDGQLGIKFQVL